MPRPLSIEPRPSSNIKLPWVVHIPEADRARFGGQKRRYFRKEGEVAAFAKVLRRQRSEHTASFNMLPDLQKSDAHQALEILAAYSTARSLTDLARAEAVRLDAAAKSKPLRLLIDDLLVEKRTDGRRERYIVGLRGTLNVFERAFPDRLASSFTGIEISAWLRTNYENPNSRDSYRRNLSVLFSWAAEKGFVPTNPVAETKAVNARREDEVAVLSPLELTTLLRVATPRLRPYLVICAFAALRPHEAQQIAWENVTARGIYVPKAITKTVARYVPVLPALTIWLDFFGPQNGKVFTHGYRTWRRDFDDCRRQAGLFESWGQDALRHSAISYWLAIEPNRAAVAMWSANSEAVQKRNYENPRSSAEAAAWYAVLPDSLTPAADEART